MNVDRHATRYFEFQPGERVNISVKEFGDRVLSKLRGAEGILAQTRHPHELTFQMPDSDLVEIELGTATTADALQLVNEPGQIIVDFWGQHGQTHRHQITAEAQPSQWTYILIPKAKFASPVWYVCSRTPLCGRRPDRTGPANVKCSICDKGVIVKVA